MRRGDGNNRYCACRGMRGTGRIRGSDAGGGSGVGGGCMGGGIENGECVGRG